MKKISCLTLFLFISLLTTLSAQHAIGSWQSYLSYHNATAVAPAGSLIYTIGNGSLYAFDKEDESVHCYWKDNQLSDTDISHIAYNRENKTLVVIYNNYNIDLLINDNETYNLPDYKDKNMSQNKTVNNIYFNGDNAYITTGFGIIVINLKRKEVSNTYNLNTNVNDCTVLDNTIYAATNAGLFTGLLTDNLLDVNNWKRQSSAVFHSIESLNGELFGNMVNNGINVINKNDYSYKQLTGGNYSKLNTFGDIMVANNNNTVTIFKTSNDFTVNSLNNTTINDLGFENNTYWLAMANDGLNGLKYKEADRNFEVVNSLIIPNSPIRNYPYFMKFANDRLLIAGGQSSSSNRRPGTLMYMDNNNWTTLQEDDIANQTNLPYQNITSIAQDPRDEKRHFATSFGQGLYEFYEDKFVRLHSLDNSTLESALPDDNARYHYVRVDGLTYDNQNNLWMLNSTPYHPIQVLKSDNTWSSLGYSSLKNPIVFKASLFDKRGNFWAISSLQNDNGVFCLNYNGTIENTSDDQHKFVGSFINQDGTLLSHKGIYCIVEDNDGAIWVGTGQGPIVLNNASRFFNNDYYCTQIKVPRNDGTNLADFLLANDQINAIAVDGGNRKWIGTETNGIYLLSPDGLETIEHFTVDNSPLPSNSITSIAIHPKSGKVYIGTLKGLVSYQGDATEGKSSFEEDQVYAYPNPVHPGYTGVITVTGLMRDSDVKITNISGKLIYEGTSIGGQFTWDGLNMQGNRVASGVYFVLAANQEGKEGIVTKIMFVR